MFNQLLRPKLRNLLSDVFKDVSYVLDDDSYSAAEYQDVVRKRFVKAWEGLVDGYKVPTDDTFLPSYSHLFLQICCRTRSPKAITGYSSAWLWTYSLDPGRNS